MELRKNVSKIICITLGFIILGMVGIYNLSIIINTNDEEKVEENLVEKFLIKEINEQPSETENTTIETPKRQNSTNYSMVIEIPNIGLKKGLCSIGQECNAVSKNIQIIKESDMPNVTNGNLILAGHNGNSNVSFFNKLDQMDIGNKINIYYKGIKYEYKLNNFYDIDKNGKATIYRDYDKTTLVLITCKKNTKDKQVVYIAYLNNKTKY